MLTNYTWCIPLFTKEADKVVHAYLVNVYSKFGGQHKVSSDNGNELKNKLFAQVTFTLGMEQVFSFSYYPQCNGCIENGHNFLMFRRCAYTLLVQLLNPKLRYVGNDKSLCPLDTV